MIFEDEKKFFYQFSVLNIQYFKTKYGYFYWQVFDEKLTGSFNHRVLIELLLCTININVSFFYCCMGCISKTGEGIG